MKFLLAAMLVLIMAGTVMAEPCEKSFVLWSWFPLTETLEFRPIDTFATLQECNREIQVAVKEGLLMGGEHFKCLPSNIDPRKATK